MLEFEWGPRDVTDQVLPYLDLAILEKHEAEPPRDYLGASAIGDPCERKVAYGYQNRKDPMARQFPARVLRIFDHGHATEPRLAGYIKDAGFDLRTTNDDGDQFGFTAFGGKFAGHCDGILLSGPGLVGWPRLWEAKSMKDELFKQLVREGVKKAFQTYYAQIQVYQALVTDFGDLTTYPALFTALNKDTDDIHFEEVQHDPVEAARCIELARKICNMGWGADAFTRRYMDQNDYRCKMCNWRQACWSPFEVKLVPLVLANMDSPPDFI